MFQVNADNILDVLLLSLIDGMVTIVSLPDGNKLMKFTSVGAAEAACMLVCVELQEAIFQTLRSGSLDLILLEPVELAKTKH